MHMSFISFHSIRLTSKKIIMFRVYSWTLNTYKDTGDTSFRNAGNDLTQQSSVTSEKTGISYCTSAKSSKLAFYKETLLFKGEYRGFSDKSDMRRKTVLRPSHVTEGAWKFVQVVIFIFIEPIYYLIK
jgi:hypothetical protein